jgi:hypothetical protein
MGDMARVMLFATMVWTQVGFVQDEQVDNPEYAWWSSFKTGSWVMFEQPCGKNALLQETYKLMELSPEKAVFECTKVENGFKYPLFPKVVPSKLPIRHPLDTVYKKPEGGEVEYQGPGGKTKYTWRRSGEGDEEIEVAGKKLKCHWIKMDYRTDAAFEMARDKSSAKTWYSKEIPGHVAQIEMTRWIQENPPHDLVVLRVAKNWRIE